MKSRTFALVGILVFSAAVIGGVLGLRRISSVIYESGIVADETHGDGEIPLRQVMEFGIYFGLVIVAAVWLCIAIMDAIRAPVATSARSLWGWLFAAVFVAFTLAALIQSLISVDSTGSFGASPWRTARSCLLALGLFGGMWWLLVVVRRKTPGRYRIKRALAGRRPE